MGGASKPNRLGKHKHKQTQNMETQTLENLFAISVKFIGPTNCKGARVRLKLVLGKATKFIPFDYAQNDSENIALAFFLSKGLTPKARTCLGKSEVALLFSFSDVRKVSGLFCK